MIGSSDAAKVHERLPGIGVVSPPEAVVHPAIDLVVLATPNDTHFPLASAALRAGKHVVVDKPFTVTVQEAEELSAIAHECGRLLSVFHNRRWESEVLAMKQVIASGKLGNIVHYECHMDRFRPNVRKRWREDPGPGAGLWFDLGPHMIDLALHLFGLPTAVQADLAVMRTGGQTDDWGHVILQYPTMRAVLHASLLVSGGTPRQTLHGTRASWIKWKPDNQEPQLQRGITPSDAGFGMDPDDALLYDGATGEITATPVPAGCQQRYYEGIRDAIRNGTPPPVTAEEALLVMKVLMACYESARTGCTVLLSA
jgi:predicted dehydrogenase